MRVTDSFFAIALCLSVPVLSQFTTASAQTAEVMYGESLVEWRTPVPDAGLDLTVSGPEGLYPKQQHPAGSRACFSLVDEKGHARPDGFYKWELVVQSGPEAAGQVQSGWFQIQGGRVVAEGTTGEKQAVVVEEGAPQNSLYIDSQGRVGVGTPVPGAQLHLKGTNTALAIENTQPGGREFVLRSQRDGSVGLFDETAGHVRWLVDAEGRVGINTAQPASTLTVDGYIEATKGFLVNGKPIGGIGMSLLGGAQPLMTEGGSNNFFGTGAGAVTTGTLNSFFGAAAGYDNTTGSLNSFFGAGAGRSNTTGHSNAFFGERSGYENQTGNFNSFFGKMSGTFNSTGAENSFFGNVAGALNTTGNYNCFFGKDAGASNESGSWNSFFGKSAGSSNTGETYNTFVGYSANLGPGADPATNPVVNATAIGARSYVARSNSLVLGGVNGFNGATAETFVGIGTHSPDRQLVVEGSQALGKFRRYNENGPDFAPAFLFERARGTTTAPLNILPGDYLGKVQFRGLVGGNVPEYGALVFIASDASQNGRFSFVDRDLTTERMVILNTGNVGIGTKAPTALLDVAGNLRVRGTIFYGAPLSIPDYVFDSDYELMPLRELGQYVEREKHLPNIPGASEINDKGVNLGEFQMTLLEKIEELTLYTVQQSQVIERQRDEAAALRGETTALREEAARMRQRAASQEDRIKALEEMVKTLVKSDKGGK